MPFARADSPVWKWSESTIHFRNVETKSHVKILNSDFFLYIDRNELIFGFRTVYTKTVIRFSFGESIVCLPPLRSIISNNWRNDGVILWSNLVTFLWRFLKSALLVFAANRNCGHFQIYCLADGKCLNKTLQCNGKSDCTDGSDESHCGKFARSKWF